MLPGDPAGLVLLLAALAPGYVYVRAAERYRSRPERSVLLELAEILVIGAACTTMSAVLVVVSATLFDGVVLDIPSWATEGTRYLKTRPYVLARTVGLVLTGACVVAYVSARIVHRKQPPTRLAGYTVKNGVFDGLGRDGKRAWLALHLRNGDVVEGYLFAYPTGASDEEEIALQRPIGLTAGPDRSRVLLSGLDHVIVPVAEIVLMGVRLEDNPEPASQQPRSSPAGRLGLRRDRRVPEDGS